MKCARTACMSMNAVCQHTQTGRLYCPRCARRINEANPQVPNLITFPKSRGEADRLKAEVNPSPPTAT